jgi:hypothetical protein
MYTLRKVMLVLLRIILICLAVFSVFLTARLVIVFFGTALEENPLSRLALGLGRVVTIRFLNQPDIQTPYGGYFELNTCFTLLFYLLLEPVGERIRRAVENWSPKRVARS